MSKRHFLYPCSLNTLYKCILNNDHDGASLRWLPPPRHPFQIRRAFPGQMGVLHAMSYSLLLITKCTWRLNSDPGFRPILILLRNIINNSSQKFRVKQNQHKSPRLLAQFRCLYPNFDQLNLVLVSVLSLSCSTCMVHVFLQNHDFAFIWPVCLLEWSCPEF